MAKLLLNLEVLQNYVLNPDTVLITEHQRILLDRLQTAFTMLMHHKDQNIVVKKLLKLYDISQRTAYNDVQMCQRLFAPSMGYDIDFLKNFIITDALQQIKIATTGTINHKAWTEARNTLVKMYTLDKQDGEQISPEMLGHNTYIVTLPDDKKIIKQNLFEMDKLSATRRDEIVSKLFSDDITEIEASAILSETKFKIEDDEL